MPAALTCAQAVAAAVVLARLARGRRRRPPLGASAPPPGEAVSIVIPARDEERRLPACLAGLRGDPDVAEVVVVDDESADGTARVAREAGARVVAGAPLPAGWAGKAWALHQGLEAARGPWVVFLDADARPRPGLVRALADAAADVDLLTAGPRFVVASAGERVVHPALLATVVYRFGPTDVDGWQPRPSRALANGQCVVARREILRALGGWRLARGSLTEDAGLARAVRAAGGRIGFADAADLLDMEGYGSARAALAGWGRSLMVPDDTPPAWLAADVAVLWLCQALPVARVLAGRARGLDRLLAGLRLLLHVGLARAYRPRGAAFWLAPLADVPVVARLTWAVLRPDRRWRGRRYRAQRGRPRPGGGRTGRLTAGASPRTGRRPGS